MIIRTNLIEIKDNPNNNRIGKKNTKKVGNND